MRQGSKERRQHKKELPAHVCPLGAPAPTDAQLTPTSPKARLLCLLSIHSETKLWLVFFLNAAHRPVCWQYPCLLFNSHMNALPHPKHMGRTSYSDATVLLINRSMFHHLYCAIWEAALLGFRRVESSAIWHNLASLLILQSETSDLARN